MKKFKLFVREYGSEILLCLAGFALLFLLLWFRLGSLTFGNASAVEIASSRLSFSWSAIMESPLNAPYSIMQWLVQLTGHDGITSMRLVSTVWAIIAMVLFYLVARQWHSPRVAGLATWLFISSSWFLHTARLATPEVLWLVGVLALVVLFTPTKSNRAGQLALPLQFLILSGLLYIPGMVWLVAVSVIIQRKNVAQAWQATSSFALRLATIVLSLALVAPLVWAFIRSPQQIAKWVGFDTNTINDPLSIFVRLIDVPKNIFWQGPADPVRWLGQLPLLSVFEILMLAVGAYFYFAHLRAARSRFIILLSLIAGLVIGIGGVASLSLVVPVIYLFVATGIAYMLREWLKVFPNNPIARSLGIAVVVAAVLLTSVYQTRSYFVAWRYSPDTAKVFDAKI